MGTHPAKRVRVAAVQLNVGQCIDDILTDVLGFISAAKKENVDIVCFPECTFDSGNEKNASALNQVRSYCRLMSQWCIIGCNLAFRGKTYNTAVLINSHGKIAGFHRKVHLCDPAYVKPGKKFEVFDTPFCKIGISVCWDTAFPRTVENMAMRGAKVVFCPLMWYYEKWTSRKDTKKTERELLRAMIRTRAYENLVGMVFANVYDPTDERAVAYSAIAETRWLLSELVGKEGMIVANIDLGMLERMRWLYLRDYGKKVCARQG